MTQPKTFYCLDPLKPAILSPVLWRSMRRLGISWKWHADVVRDPSAQHSSPSILVLPDLEFS